MLIHVDHDTFVLWRVVGCIDNDKSSNCTNEKIYILVKIRQFPVWKKSYFCSQKVFLTCPLKQEFLSMKSIIIMPDTKLIFNALWYDCPITSLSANHLDFCSYLVIFCSCVEPYWGSKANDWTSDLWPLDQNDIGMLTMIHHYFSQVEISAMTERLIISSLLLQTWSCSFKLTHKQSEVVAKFHWLKFDVLVGGVELTMLDVAKDFRLPFFFNPTFSRTSSLEVVVDWIVSRSAPKSTKLYFSSQSLLAPPPRRSSCSYCLSVCFLLRCGRRPSSSASSWLRCTRATCSTSWSSATYWWDAATATGGVGGGSMLWHHIGRGQPDTRTKLNNSNDKGRYRKIVLMSF